MPAQFPEEDGTERLLWFRIPVMVGVLATTVEGGKEMACESTRNWHDWKVDDSQAESVPAAVEYLGFNTLEDPDVPG